jgi:hypothetical protein
LNYDSLTELHTREITVISAHVKFSEFASRCLVAVSNGGHSPSSGLPNCLRPHVAAARFSQLQLLTEQQFEVEVTLRLTVGRSVGRSVSQTVSQSVSMSWYRAPLWDLRPDITSCRNVPI